MKFCPECGEDLMGSTKFCPECGFNIASLVVQETIEKTTAEGIPEELVFDEDILQEPVTEKTTGAPISFVSDDNYDIPNTNECATCEIQISYLDKFACYFCSQAYCIKHRLPENHNCSKVMAAKHIERNYLRKRGTNITTGRYMVLCKDCGFRTGFTYIEEANQQRINHIKTNRCSGSSVKLREHDDDRRDDDDFAEYGNMP